MPASLREIRNFHGIKPRGTTAETRFKRVVRALHYEGYAPTPSNILYCIFKAANPTGQGNNRGGPNLNGREAAWRRDVLLDLGYERVDVGYTHRWKRPA